VKNFLSGVVLTVLTLTLAAVPMALAHSGSPSPTTWSNGSTLTAAALNDTISHIHNIFNGGIVDAHVSASAAIAHSKLATPALVAKAVLSTTTACDGSQAAGTDCTTDVAHSKFLASSAGAGNGNSALEAAGTAGTYFLTLGYTPTNANYTVLVSSGTTSVWCSVTGRATAAPHIGITCESDASSPTNTNLNIVVFDTD